MLRTTASDEPACARTVFPTALIALGGLLVAFSGCTPRLPVARGVTTAEKTRRLARRKQERARQLRFCLRRIKPRVRADGLLEIVRWPEIDREFKEDSDPCGPMLREPYQTCRAKLLSTPTASLIGLPRMVGGLPGIEESLEVRREGGALVVSRVMAPGLSVCRRAGTKRVPVKVSYGRGIPRTRWVLIHERTDRPIRFEYSYYPGLCQYAQSAADIDKLGLSAAARRTLHHQKIPFDKWTLVVESPSGPASAVIARRGLYAAGPRQPVYRYQKGVVAVGVWAKYIYPCNPLPERIGVYRRARVRVVLHTPYVLIPRTTQRILVSRELAGPDPPCR